jgi:hypothetical protein
VIGYREEQRFPSSLLALLALLVGIPLGVAVLFLIAVPAGRVELATIGIAPVIVGLVGLLLAASRLVVEVGEDGVRIAFPYIWPTRRIAFHQIASISVRRYNPLLEYGGWGVRLGPKGWAFTVSGGGGVQLRLWKGIPVLIGSRRPGELEAAIRSGMERALGSGS